MFWFFLRRALVFAISIALAACVSHAAPAFAKQTLHPERTTWFACARTELPRALERYDFLLEESAHDAGISKDVLIGIMMTESLGNAKAPGGLMQTRDSVKDALGIACDERHASCSIMLAARYVRYLSDRYHYSFERTIVAYNRGPSGARKVSDPSRDQYYTRVSYIMHSLNPRSELALAD